MTKIIAKLLYNNVGRKIPTYCANEYKENCY